MVTMKSSLLKKIGVKETTPKKRVTVEVDQVTREQVVECYTPKKGDTLTLLMESPYLDNPVTVIMQGDKPKDSSNIYTIEEMLILADHLSKGLSKEHLRIAMGINEDFNGEVLKESSCYIPRRLRKKSKGCN